MDLRDEFRPKLKQCNNCLYWGYVLHPIEGTTHGSCTVSPNPVWTRASNRCPSWEKQNAPR